MLDFSKTIFFLFFFTIASFGQSGRMPIYSESNSDKSRIKEIEKKPDVQTDKIDDDDVIRIGTNLVIVPAQVSERNGNPVQGLIKEDFRIFENGAEQEILHFKNEDQPFTVALILDMSYSSVFKLIEIQSAALTFIGHLRENDKVMIVSFDEKVHVLCEPTNNKKVLKLAVEATKIASGTSVYSALDLVLREKLSNLEGRKAIVLLSDGVDTGSPNVTAENIIENTDQSDVLIYPIQYNTWDDVQKSRKDNSQVFYDDNDRAYTVEFPRKKGEREEDYQKANSFLKAVSVQTGGKVFRVSSKTNLNKAFDGIANELRQIYSLGYYPSEERKVGVIYSIRVRVYRPNLLVRARDNYVGQPITLSPD